MTSARAFLLFTGLVLTGALALLWGAFGLRTGETDPTRTRTQTAPSVGIRPSEPEPGGVRTVYPGLGPAPVAPSRERFDDRFNARAPETDAPPAAPPSPAPAPPIEAAAEPPPVAGVDLNTATVEQLNGLGAGMIGRTIIANRPYADPQELLARRVLNRRDYETIRPHIAVR